MLLQPSSYGPKQHKLPCRATLSPLNKQVYGTDPLENDETRLTEPRPACDGPELRVSFKRVY